MPPGRRKTLPVETGRHAFAYVFDGSGSFRSASEPFGVLTEKEGGNGETLVREQKVVGDQRPHFPEIPGFRRLDQRVYVSHVRAAILPG